MNLVLNKVLIMEYPGNGDLFISYFLILQGRYTCYFLELQIEIGNIIKPTFITNTGNIEFVFQQQLTGIPDPYFIEVMGKAFPGTSLEGTAKGWYGHIRHFGYLPQRNILPEIGDDILMHFGDRVCA